MILDMGGGYMPDFRRIFKQGPKPPRRLRSAQENLKIKIFFNLIFFS